MCIKSHGHKAVLLQLHNRAAREKRKYSQDDATHYVWLGYAILQHHLREYIGLLYW